LFANIADHTVVSTSWDDNTWMNFVGAKTNLGADIKNFDFLFDPGDDLWDVGGNKGIANGTIWSWDLVAKLLSKFDDFFLSLLFIEELFNI